MACLTVSAQAYTERQPVTRAQAGERAASSATRLAVSRLTDQVASDRLESVRVHRSLGLLAQLASEPPERRVSASRRRCAWWLGFSACTASLLAGQPAWAAPVPEACFRAYEQGQRLEKDRRPLAARGEYTKCVALCPEPLRTDCKTWQDHAESKLARIVLRVAHGGSEVQITLDGEPVAQQPVLWVGPGAHEIRATAHGFVEQRETVDLLEGEELPVVISLRKLEAAPQAEASHPAAWIALGVGAVGLASFAYFGLSGLSKKRDLDGCRTHCSVAAVDAARSDFLLADISLLVGLIGAGVGVTLLLDSSSDSAPHATPGQPRALWLRARPTAGGLGVWLGADAW